MLYIICTAPFFIYSCKNEINQNGDVANHEELDSLNEQAHELLRVNLQECKTESEKNEELCRKVGYTFGQARALSTLGNVYDALGNCDSSVIMHRLALDLRLQLDDPIWVGKSYNNIAEAYTCLRDYETALEFADSALEVYQRIGDLNALSAASCNIAINYKRLKNDDSAGRWFYAAINYAEKTDNKKRIFKSYYNYGNFLRSIGKTDSSLWYLYKARDIAFAEDYKADIPGLFMSIGQGIKQFDPKKALELYDSALVLVEDQGAKGLQEKVLRAKISILKDSLKYDNDLVLLYDSLFTVIKNNFDEERIEDFANFEVKYRTAEVEAENKLIAEHSKVMTRWFIFITFLVVLISFLIIRGLVQRRKLAEKDKELSEKKIDALLTRQEMKKIDDLLEFQENERNRIASDLHDRLGSILGAVKLNFSSMEAEIKRIEQQNIEQYGIVKDLIDQAATEVRKIAHDMASGVLTKFGLVPAVRDLKKVLEASGKITINIHEFGMDERLSSHQEITVYRIIQELVSNALKHARAKNIDIHFTKSEYMFSVIVEDDGVGFAQSDGGKKGIGLANIEKRANELGGSFTIDSSPKSGTTAIFELVLNDE